MKLRRFFSISNDDNYRKIVTILGIKFKFTNYKKLYLKQSNMQIKSLEAIKIKLTNKNDIYQINSVKFYLPDFPADYISREIIMNNNFYELDELEALNKYIKDDAIIIDAGANIGNHTIYWLTTSPRKVQKVYSFEPVKSTFEKLSKNIELNNLLDKAKIFNVGLSDENTFASVNQFSIRNVGGTSLKKDSEGDFCLKRLDDVEIKENHIDFMKIDVEGHELNMLKGAVNTINKYKPTIFIECFENNFESVRKFFKNNNYELVKSFNITHNYIFKYKDK